MIRSSNGSKVGSPGPRSFEGSGLCKFRALVYPICRCPEHAISVCSDLTTSGGSEDPEFDALALWYLSRTGLPSYQSLYLRFFDTIRQPGNRSSGVTEWQSLDGPS